MAKNTVSRVPVVNFGLLRGEHRVTEYIQTSNPCMERVAAGIKGHNVNDCINHVAQFVARHVCYALDKNGQPSAVRHTRVFRFHGPIYLVDTGELPYGWLMPNQTVNCGFGICFDMSALCCTLLRLKGVRAEVVLGAVVTTKRRRLRGFHAWVETVDKDSRLLVVETTSPRKPMIWLASDIYGGKFPLTYEPVCWFSDVSWREDEAKSKKYSELTLRALQKEKKGK